MRSRSALNNIPFAAMTMWGRWHLVGVSAQFNQKQQSNMEELLEAVVSSDMNLQRGEYQQDNQCVSVDDFWVGSGAR
jgi:hypothetical protein